MVQFIGLDVHRKETVACIYNPQTQEERYHTIPTREDQLAAFLQNQPWPSRVAFEVTGMAGRLYDRLAPLVDDLQVANPSQIPWIYRTAVKTDRLDAKKLAVLMSVGQLPTVHMPSAAVRAWRNLIQHRRRLVQQRCQVKNRIRALLVNEGIGRPVKGGWWTQKNVRWITAQVEHLCRPVGLRLQDQLDQLDLFNRQVQRVTEELDKRAAGHAGVALLRTIPGIGPRTAEAILAYADEWQRFSRSRQFAAYFGVTPRLDESAGRSRHGHISKQGPSVVRWLLVEAAWRSLARSPALRAFFDRVMHGQKNRKKIALVAVARKLLTICFSMLRTGEEYNELLVG